MTHIGDRWIAQQWRRAQVRAGIPQEISFHDLRHQFVSLLIAAGKHPKYIGKQARHHKSGYTLDEYGELFEELPITPVEWWDDLIWPDGCPLELGTIWSQNYRLREESRISIEESWRRAVGIEPTGDRLASHRF